MRFSFVLSFATLLASALGAPLFARLEQVSNVKCTGTTYVSRALELSPLKLTNFLYENRALDFHTVNVALLQICGGIAGTIEKCEGAPTSTTGQSGNALFTITPVEAGATINISKGRWERE